MNFAKLQETLLKQNILKNAVKSNLQDILMSTILNNGQIMQKNSCLRGKWQAGRQATAINERA